MGIFTDTVTCCGHACMIIEKLRARQDANLATPKQIRLLEKYGFYHVGTWDFNSASKMITRIANNNWFLPRGIDAASYQP
jgi:predicted lipase